MMKEFSSCGDNPRNEEKLLLSVRNTNIRYSFCKLTILNKRAKNHARESNECNPSIKSADFNHDDDFLNL